MERGPFDCPQPDTHYPIPRGGLGQAGWRRVLHDSLHITGSSPPQTDSHGPLRLGEGLLPPLVLSPLFEKGTSFVSNHPPEGHCHHGAHSLAQGWSQKS